jgi:hypothetical protein
MIWLRHDLLGKLLQVFNALHADLGQLKEHDKGTVLLVQLVEILGELQCTVHDKIGRWENGFPLAVVTQAELNKRAILAWIKYELIPSLDGMRGV